MAFVLILEKRQAPTLTAHLGVSQVSTRPIKWDVRVWAPYDGDQMKCVLRKEPSAFVEKHMHASRFADTKRLATQRCVTNNGLTNLRGFRPVRHTLYGPNKVALPTSPRHTVSRTKQITRLSCPMSERTALI